jgi:beta-phosphoglucomutase
MLESDNHLHAVVFDMDGVLIDSHPAHRAAWREFLRLMGREVSELELAFILDGRKRAEILRHFLGDLDDRELQDYGRRKDEIFRGMERQIAPVRGVLDFITELNRHGIRMAVATSASEIRTFSTIERMGLGGCFEAVITASDVLAGKPDPAVYRLACMRMGIPPYAALAFDDASAGIEAAKSAGMRCIGVASNGLSASLLQSGAEKVIPHFEGLALGCLMQAA